MQELKSSKKKIVGMKQTLRAIQNDNVKRVYIAMDADAHIKRTIFEACNRANIELIEVNTMKELGEACKIEVGASTVALLAD